MKSKINLSNFGVVISVRGSVVDVRFDERLPSIYSVLLAGCEGHRHRSAGPA
jgi:F-type H+-transporting ATPase subunit beta